MLAEIAVYSVVRHWKGWRCAVADPAARLRMSFAGVMIFACVPLIWFAAFRLDPENMGWMREVPVAAVSRLCLAAFACLCIRELARGLPWWVIPAALVPPGIIFLLFAPTILAFK